MESDKKCVIDNSEYLPGTGAQCSTSSSSWQLVNLGCPIPEVYSCPPRPPGAGRLQGDSGVRPGEGGAPVLYYREGEVIQALPQFLRHPSPLSRHKRSAGGTPGLDLRLRGSTPRHHAGKQKCWHQEVETWWKWVFFWLKSISNDEQPKTMRQKMSKKILKKNTTVKVNGREGVGGVWSKTIVSRFLLCFYL